MSLQLPDVNINSLVVSSLAIAGLGLLRVLLSEAVLGKIILILLRHMAKKTSNEIDDEIVATVEAALAKKSQD